MRGGYRYFDILPSSNSTTTLGSMSMRYHGRMDLPFRRLLVNPHQLPAGSCSSSRCGCMLPVCSSKQVPAIEHHHLWNHPEEGVSSGCQYLCIQYMRYACLRCPPSHVKSPCESQSRRYGSRAFGPRMGYCWLLMAIAAGIVRHKERAREAAGWLRLGCRNAFGSEVLDDLEPVNQLSYMYPRIGRWHLHVSETHLCCYVDHHLVYYIPLGILHRQAACWLTSSMNGRASSYLYKHLQQVNVMHHKRPCGQPCDPKPVALAMLCYAMQPRLAS